MSQFLSERQTDQVHQVAQTTILAMFMRGFCVEATSANDAVKRIVLSYTKPASGLAGEIQLSFIGSDDEVLAGFEI